MKKIFRLFLPALLTAFLIAICGCSADGSRPDNYPYEPDTPEPAAHEGSFVSEHGSMYFPGDGENIEIEFDAYLAGLTGLPEGEHKGTYVFLSGDLPPHGSVPVRYDTAHEMEITVDDKSVVIDMGIAADDGKSGQVGVNVVSPERIPMLFHENDGFFNIVFSKE